MNAVVVTVSDRSASGERDDVSGVVAAEMLTAHSFSVSRVVVPDDREAIVTALRDALTADVVLTTGGTGFGPRDVTPEATAEVVDRTAPGLAEAVRAGGKVPTTVLSRGIAGAAGTTLVINLAGSPGAVRDGLTVLLPLLPHVVDQLHGGEH